MVAMEPQRIRVIESQDIGDGLPLLALLKGDRKMDKRPKILFRFDTIRV
jgi:hypothetical protein